MAITTTYTAPASLDLNVGQQLTETVWDQLISNINKVGGGTGTIGASVTHNANQSVNDSTNTVLAFNTERFDTAPAGATAWHDTSSNNSRLTFPIDGTYLIHGQVCWATDGDGYRILELLANGSEVVARTRMASSGTAGPTNQEVSVTRQFLAAQYVELRCYHTAGAAINVETQTSYSPQFSAVKV